MTKQKEAKAVAEFLGMYAVINKDHQFPEIYKGIEWFNTWLATDAGTVAMEKQLLTQGFSVLKEEVDGGIDIEVDRDDVKGKGPCCLIQLTAEDVNKGLQAAILEVLKNAHE